MVGIGQQLDFVAWDWKSKWYHGKEEIIFKTIILKTQSTISLFKPKKHH